MDPSIENSSPLPLFWYVLLSKHRKLRSGHPCMHFSSSLFLCKHKRALSLIIYSRPRHVAVWQATEQSQGVVLNGAGRNRNLVDFVFLAFAFKRQSTNKPRKAITDRKQCLTFPIKTLETPQPRRLFQILISK
jgi:hypothetical protein